MRQQSSSHDKKCSRKHLDHILNKKRLEFTSIGLLIIFL